MPDAVIVHVYEDAQNQLEAFIVSLHLQNLSQPLAERVQVVTDRLRQPMWERHKFVGALLALVFNELGHNCALAHFDQLVVSKTSINPRVQGFEFSHKRGLPDASRLRENFCGLLAGLGRDLACDAH